MLKQIKETFFNRNYIVIGQEPVSTTETDKIAEKLQLTPEEKEAMLELIKYYQSDYRPALKSIFTKILEKSGIPIESSNLALIDKLKLGFIFNMSITGNNSIIGNFNPSQNLISINLKALPEISKTYLEHFFLNTLSHEISHSQGRNTSLKILLIYAVLLVLLSFKIPPLWVGTYFIKNIKTGITKSNLWGQKSFNGANEGITMILEYIIADQICKQQGIKINPILKEITSLKTQFENNDTYSIYVYIILKLVEKISQDTKVDQKVVMGSFLRSYMTGKDFDTSIFKEKINSYFGPRFYREFKKLNPSSEHYQEKAINFLKKYFPDYESDYEKVFTNMTNLLDLS